MGLTTCDQKPTFVLKCTLQVWGNKYRCTDDATPKTRGLLSPIKLVCFTTRPRFGLGYTPTSDAHANMPMVAARPKCMV
jgi:hypothetical protein